MNKTKSFAILFIATVFIFSQAIFQKGYSNRSGAPIGRTGSPFDNSGVSCNVGGCHVGSAPINETGWITSTIPGTGYAPGTTYTITGAAAAGSLIRFGFEISAQTNTGAQAGTNIITNTATTRLAGASNPKYVTHTTTGTDASATPGNKAWSFNWTAPAAGTGTVTFYGAFNCTNNSNSTSGDVVHLSQLVVPEDLSAGWAQAENQSHSFDAYPNPASENIFISVTSKNAMLYTVQLMDVAGKCVRNFSAQEINAGAEIKSVIDIRGVNPGIYFLQVQSKESIAVKKMMVI